MEKQCRVCGVVFSIKHSLADKRFCCGRKCSAEYQKTSMKGAGNPHYKNLPPKICLVCGIEFRAYDKKRKYCSMACNGKSDTMRERLCVMAKMKKPRKETCGVKYQICVKCNILFSYSAHTKRKYCSPCSMARKPVRECRVCGRKFLHKCFKKTCSPKCQRKSQADVQRGEKSHRWEGGKTSQALIIRGSYEYKEWRKEVFSRDNYTCQECGQRGGKLNADHIKSFAHFPELRLDVNNGRTLCFECHTKTPNFAMKAVYQKH